MTSAAVDDRVRDIAHQLQLRIWSECDPEAIVRNGPEQAHAVVRGLAARFLSHDNPTKFGALNRAQERAVLDRVVAAVLGYGPLDELLTDPSVSEVMVNGAREVYVERHGRVERVAASFDDDEHVQRVLDRMLAPIGRRVDALAPIVDARLPDGSRVHAVVPPLAVDGPAITIRRFVQCARTLTDLVQLNAMTDSERRLIQQLVMGRANVLVSGGTSTGKTTLLAAALAASAREDRIVVLEEAAELPLEHPHRVRLEGRPVSQEGVSAIELRELVRASLRMRPDRIVIGEVRGAEAWDLVQALTTGHRGSWSTIHADSSQDALVRLESLALTSGVAVPHGVLRTQIGRSIDALIQLERRGDVRRIASITRVTPSESHGWVLEDVSS